MTIPDFNWAEEGMRVLGEIALSREEVNPGGGNIIFAQGEYMLASMSGKPLGGITREKMVIASAPATQVLLDKTYSAIPKEREDEHDNDRMSMIVVGDKKGTIELPPHKVISGRIMEQQDVVDPRAIVYHPHRREITALTCIRDWKERAAEHFGDGYILIDFDIPGIGLGQSVQKALRGYEGNLKGVVQGNHNAWFGAPNLETLVGERQRVVDSIRGAIDRGIREKGLDVTPYGDDHKKYDGDISEGSIRAICKSIYKHNFTEGYSELDTARLEDYNIDDMNVQRIQTSKGVMYVATGGLARKYAESKKAEEIGREFLRITPDHIVAGGMNTPYLETNSLVS